MMNIKISVILPNYNGEKHLANAITSFLRQDYENKELIIVDGKSSDQSHGIIKEFILKSDLIKWVEEKDTNVTDAINIGLKYCTGDFISFLASDVKYFSNNLFSRLNEVHHHIPYDLVYLDHYYYHSYSKKVYLHKCPNVEFTRNNLLIHGTIAGFDSVFVSAKIYERFKLNPKYNLCSDWEFFLRISQEKYLFLYLEKIGTVDELDGDNLSVRFHKEQMRQIKEVGDLYNTEKVRLYFEPPSFRRYFKVIARMVYGKIVKG